MAVVIDRFIATKEYRRFAEFLDACKRYRYIGVCSGVPGVGKTLSARRYARWELLERHFHRTERFAPHMPEVASCRSVFYTPEVTNSPRRVREDIRTLMWRFSEAVDWAMDPDADRGLAPKARDGVPGYTELVIVDEADRLKFPSLEQLRDTHDRTGVGLILIGMPGIEKRLARYPQLYSRVGFVHHYKTAGADEMVFILERKWRELGLASSPGDYTDAEAMAAIVRVTAGNFRLLQRLFAQIERLMEVNSLKTITKEVVEKAREGMVIGALG